MTDKATFQSVVAQNRMVSFAAALSKLKKSEAEGESAKDDKKTHEHPQEILLTPRQVLNKDQVATLCCFSTLLLNHSANPATPEPLHLAHSRGMAS